MGGLNSHINAAHIFENRHDSQFVNLGPIARALNLGVIIRMVPAKGAPRLAGLAGGNDVEIGMRCLAGGLDAIGQKSGQGFGLGFHVGYWNAPTLLLP